MGGIFNKEVSPHRTIHFQRQYNNGFCNNQVETTKYTWYSFLPKAILLQFIRPANFVYLISAILQSIKVVSSLNPITAIAPFVFVISISLIREGYQDYKRYKKDKQINTRKARRLVNGQFIETTWAQLHVGDIILVKSNQTLPADFLLLHTSEQNSVCYVQTANLDGESNLKAKFAYNIQHHKNILQFQKIRGQMIVQLPNSFLHQFTGLIKIEYCDEKNIDFDNFMLRETVLKNTQQVVGVIVYAGYDTKIVQNQGHVQNKVSQVQRKVNIIQGVLLGVLILLSAACTIGFHIYHNVNNQRLKLTYLRSQVQSYSLQVTLIYFSSFLLLTFLIPISLNVSIEVIKGFLGIFLEFDKKMYYQPIKKSCNANNVSILQELGQIDYILTDKTGTLTANEMVFKQLSVAGRNYTSQQIIVGVNNYRQNIDFHQFWIGLIICHDVVCQPQSGDYQGSSPDEVCFVMFAKKIQYQFVSRTRSVIQLKVFNQKISFQLLSIIPFDNRKRMSVIVRDLKTKKIYIYTKGADSSMFPKSLPSEHSYSLQQSINKFAKQGYRTLLFGYRQIPLQEYQALQSQKFQIKAIKTKKSISKQQIQSKQNNLAQLFQSKLILLGATAIQDKLQDDVPNTIQRLQAAGIVVMMITGDKLQTAQNIGYLANFIKKQSVLRKIRSGMTDEQIANIIGNILQLKRINTNQSISVMIEGSSISKFLQSPNPNYVQMLQNVSSVIFCRSSPKQKAQIVKYVKQKLKGVVLAIGDGGNDVGMIQVANVGVGILGKEGNSASAISDFSIGQFKYLDRLVLHHGRWFYYRLSYFFVFYGWKNLIMTLLLFFFMIDSAFSAATGLSQPFIAIYNIVIGLVLVVYFAVFQQDINDDQFKPAYKKLPIYYKQIKDRDLFSYKRYIIWTIFSVIIAIFMYLSTRYAIGSSYAIDNEGHVGSFSHHSSLLAIALSIMIIMVLISDVKMYTWFSAFIIIGLITIIGTIVFFIFQNYVQIGLGTSYLVLSKSTFRYWLVVFLNVGVVYAGKLVIDTVYLLYYETEIDKTIRLKSKSSQQIHSQSLIAYRKVQSLNQYQIQLGTTTQNIQKAP